MPHSLRGQSGYLLTRQFIRLCNTPSDINEHLPFLHYLASRCNNVVELGVRHAVSTVAFLSALRPVFAVDMVLTPTAVALARTYELLKLHQADSRMIQIPPTDLLFIDTLHTDKQLWAELTRHWKDARRWIVLHDTVTYGINGEVPGSAGLNFAVYDFTKYYPFKVVEHFENNNGLTVLERTDDG